MKLSDLRELSVVDMLSKVESLEPQESIARVIGFMRERKLSEAFVEEKERTGIITLRDLLEVRNITSTKVSTIMSYVPRLNSNNNVGDAATLMFEHRIRSLPVYNNGRSVGKIDSSSIISKLVDIKPDVKINKLMTPNPVTVREDDDIGKARSMMIRRKIDQVPVVRDGKLVSVVGSESIVYNILPATDRLAKGELRQGRFDAPVHDFAHSDFTQSDVKDTLSKAFDAMKKAQRTYSVITSFDEIQGIVTHRDFMKILVELKSSDGIPMYIVGLPVDPFEAEVAREKFTRIVNLVRKGFPDILEARAIIKSGETKSARRRYRVHVLIATPKGRNSYTAFGFELPNVFDDIEKWAKRLVASYNTKRRRTRSDPGEVTERATLWVA